MQANKPTRTTLQSVRHTHSHFNQSSIRGTESNSGRRKLMQSSLIPFLVVPSPPPVFICNCVLFRDPTVCHRQRVLNRPGPRHPGPPCHSLLTLVVVELGSLVLCTSVSHSFYVVWGCGHTGDVCKKNPVFHSCFFDALCHMCVNSRYDGNPVSRHPSVHVSLTLWAFLRALSHLPFVAFDSLSHDL